MGPESAYNGPVHTTRNPLHRWDISPTEAIRIQFELADRLRLRWDRRRRVRRVAGIDVSVRNDRSTAAVVVLDFPDLTPVEAVTAARATSFPYVPGLLTFREGPVVLDAWAKLSRRPDLVLFDGQGIAHPRRMGLAAHMGLWLDVPSIGCAKSRLYGVFSPPGSQKGDTTRLLDERDPTAELGCVVRSRTDVRPLFVSPGHRIDVETATRFTLACCSEFRLPEPTRWAHRASRGESIV